MHHWKEETLRDFFMLGIFYLRKIVEIKNKKPLRDYEKKKKSSFFNKSREKKNPA